MGRPRRACKIVAAAVLCCGHAALADHFVATWTANTGGWANPTNWDTNPVYPDNGADTFDAVIDSSGANVTLNANITIDGLYLSDGRLLAAGAQTLTLQASSYWTGGHIDGSGNINVNSSLEIGPDWHLFTRATINIDPAATVLWSGGYIDAPDEFGGGGTINNDGLFVDQTDQNWTWGNVLTPVFNNTGSYVKTDGTVGSKKKVFAAMNNTGSVDAQTGDLWFSGGGTSSGSFTVSADARLFFSDYNQIFSTAQAPITTLTEDASVSSSGSVIFGNDFGNATTEIFGVYDSVMTVVDAHDPAQAGNDGQVTFRNGALVNTSAVGGLEVQSGTIRFETAQAGGVPFSNVNLVGGVIDTADDLFFDTLDWSGGVIKGNSTLTAVSTGDLTFTTTNVKSLIDVSLYNGIGSTATIDTGEVSMQNAEIRNLSNASFDIQGDATLSNPDASQYTAIFVNAGDLLKTGPGTGLLNDVKLVNDGTVSVLSGTLRLNGGGDHTGTFLISTGAALELGASSQGTQHNLGPGSIVIGDTDSDLRITGATDADATVISVDRLTMSAYMVARGAMSAASTRVELYGQVNYTASTFNAGALELVDGGTFALSPGNDKVLQASSVDVDVLGESILDLSDNKAIVAYGEDPSPADSIRQLLQAGYNGGSWDGAGIVTTLGDSVHFGIGYGDNSVLGRDSFGGLDVDASSVLIEYTYYGDTDLNGRVDLLDVYNLALHFNSPGLWTGGDFDYNGFVDARDLGLLSRNWLSGTGPLNAAFNDALSHANGVPEPAGVGALALAAWSLKRTRRRK